MKYNRLGWAGVRVSELCLGTMMFGGATSREDSIQIIHRAIDDGINFIDTADMYNNGESERILGDAIRDRRDQLVIATKVKQPMGSGPNDQGASRYHIIAGCEQSLNRMSLDHIDLYYLHQFDWDTPLEESLRALDDLVRQGKVRYIGCSNYYAYQVVEGLWASDRQLLEKFCCIQPLYNMVNRDSELELFPMCEKYEIGVVPYSPLARGVLTGKYKPGESFPDGSRAARGDKRIQETELREESFQVAQRFNELAQSKGVPLSQLALAWVRSSVRITSTIIGPRVLEQYQDNLKSLDCEVTAEDEAIINGVVQPGEHTGRGYSDPNYPVRGR